VQSGRAGDLERLLHQGLGATEEPEPRLPDPLFQVEIGQDVGGHVRHSLLAALPPARESNVVPAERRAVHELDHRVAYTVLSPASTDDLR
jgi:hypothetical protein